MLDRSDVTRHPPVCAANVGLQNLLSAAWAPHSQVFLDGHVSPAAGWERPLIRHMETNYKRIVVPVIPIIDEVLAAFASEFVR